jgi:GntR family transcriptional regulator
MIQIDPTHPVPLYLQIAEQLRRRIAMGVLRPGERVPTVREIAVAAQVNRNTAARAIQHLESEGVVRTRVGQGTFVIEGGARVDREAGEAKVDESIDSLLIEAHTLGIPHEELGWRLSRRIEKFRRQRDEESKSQGEPE